MFKIAVLISGSGTNLQSIIDNIKDGYLKNCTIEYVISDKKDVFGLKRAKENNIKTMVFDKNELKEDLSCNILKFLKGKVDLIVLAGFTSILKENIIDEFRNKIINIHPSLIPSFCGKGMYGLKVHEAVIEYGVKISGCTVHFVDHGTDTGSIIIQKVIDVKSTYSAKESQQEVLKIEHKALPEAIKLISEGRIKIDKRKVIVS